MHFAAVSDDITFGLGIGGGFLFDYPKLGIIGC